MKYGIFLRYTSLVYIHRVPPGAPENPENGGFFVLVGKVERVWGLDRHHKDVFGYMF